MTQLHRQLGQGAILRIQIKERHLETVRRRESKGRREERESVAAACVGRRRGAKRKRGREGGRGK